MIQYRIPVRNNTPQLLTYTFKDQNGNIIDLTNAISCSVEIKLQGQLYATLVATILPPPSAGQVSYPSYTFTSPGVWSVQFVCTDGLGNKTFGEPIQITVVPNVEDLALGQLPVY